MKKLILFLFVALLTQVFTSCKDDDVYHITDTDLNGVYLGTMDVDAPFGGVQLGADDIKQKRLDRLMDLQQNISGEIASEKIGKVFKVIIDRKEGDYYIGRTEFSSPEVDPEVLIPVSEKRLRTGCFYNVKITDAEEFDLYGTVNY